MYLNLIGAFALLLFLPTAALAQTADSAEEGVFATIDGEVIAENEFWQAFRQGVRDKFYHGQVPAAELDAFAREVADRIIDQHVLLDEARSGTVKPDTEWVEARVASFVEANQDKPMFDTHREEILQRVRGQLETRSLLKRIEDQFRQQVTISDSEVRAFFDANPDVFVEPEQVRVGLILLRVDPGAPSDDWVAARDRIQVLRQQIEAGVPFEDVARDHSDDPSAELGGDMGYLHEGMLGGHAQGVVDKLAEGGVSEPVALLEGAALLKLIERKPAVAVGFERARDRAAALALADKKDKAWQNYVEALRAAREIEIKDTVFAKIRASASGMPNQQPANATN